jgi:hypothetical protein
MHLRVTTLSDIVDAQGKHITEEIFKGGETNGLVLPVKVATTTGYYHKTVESMESSP